MFGLRQVAKLLVLVQSALDLRFWVKKVRREGVDEFVGEVGLEVTVQERVKHEKGESEIKRETTYARNIPFRVLEPCVCVIRMKVCPKCAQTRCARVVCRKMCVQQVSVCIHHPSHTQWLLLRESEPLLLLGSSLHKKSRQKKSSLHDHLERIPSDFSPGSFFDLSHQDVFH